MKIEKTKDGYEVIVPTRVWGVNRIIKCQSYGEAQAVIKKINENEQDLFSAFDK